MARADRPTADDFMVPKDPEKLISWLDKKREAGRKSMPVRQMKLNMLFMLGEQWLTWDDRNSTFRRPRVARSDDPNAPVRITANKVGEITEHYISRLLKANPEPEARPMGDTPADVDSAKVAGRIMLSELNRLEWQSMQVDLYFWVVPLGYSYLQVAWDPDAGPMIGEHTFEGAPQATEVHEGAIVVDVAPAFELSVDPNSKHSDLTDAHWACRTVYMTDEAIWEKWGVVPDGASAGQSLAQEVYSLINSGQNLADKRPVHQFWLRPGGRTRPEGMVVTWCGRTRLEEPMPFPFEHGKLPFVQWDLLPGLGTREGRTWMKDLIPLQADYNDARSREAVIRRTLVPKIIAPVGSIDPRRVTSRVEVISYNPVSDPPHIEIPDGRWMAQYEGAMERAEREMGSRAGQNDVASTGAKASMPAAAILALQEQDDTKLAIPAKENARSVERLGLQILELVRQFWTEERMVRTWSEDGYLEVQRFAGSNVAQQLDIHVSAESALPKSKAAKVQLAMELKADGTITDPRQFIRMLDVPGVDFIVQSLDKDAAQQRRELGKLIQGQQVPINTWDNHPIHYEELNDYRKTEEYEQQPPEIKAVIDAHADAHLEMIASQARGMGMLGPPAGPEGAAGDTGGGATPEYLNPATGKPNDSVEVARGNAPSALAGSRVAKRAEIGAPGQPGRVPGINVDTQAAQMGR